MRNKIKIGSGTGFLYVWDDEVYLITNYHVITCRDPKNPEFLLNGYPDSPDRIEFTLTKRNDLSGRVIFIDLSEDAIFLEHSERNEGVDIVALKIIFNTELKKYVTSQNDLSLVEDINIEVTSNLFIVGYPWGNSAITRFPIWKKGTVASEPNLHIGVEKIFIDTITHPGMSGSPVFASEERSMLIVSKKTHDLYHGESSGKTSALERIMQLDPNDLKRSQLVKHFQLIGVYSGRLTMGINDPQLGIVWPLKLIKEVLQHGVRATNPYPPIIN